MNYCSTCGGTSCGSTCSVLSMASGLSTLPGSSYWQSATAPAAGTYTAVDDEYEIPELTHENVMRQAWEILCQAQYTTDDMNGMSLLVQTHIWLAEELRVSTEKIPEKVKNLLDAYKQDVGKGKGNAWEGVGGA